MLPYTENTDDFVSEFEEESEKTKTFEINLNKNIMGGIIDELDALKQNIYLRLNVESDQFIIYPYTYGLKKVDLIGKPYYYVAAVIPDRIRDALLMDDRITDVSDFDFEVDKNKLTVKFVVYTIYGENIEEEMEVAY